jgi:hypothetical protein
MDTLKHPILKYPKENIIEKEEIRKISKDMFKEYYDELK